MSTVFLIPEAALFPEGKPAFGAKELIKQYIRNETPFLILTDRSSTNRVRMAERMYEAGFPLLSEDHFFTSLLAAINTLNENMPDRNHFFHLGNECVKEELEANGFVYDEEMPDWIFIASSRNSSMEDCHNVLRMVRRGARMLSLSDDATEHSMKGDYPGVGAVTGMLEAASGKKARPAGRNSPVLIREAAKYLGAELTDTVLISTFLIPDIAVAQFAGAKGMFVLDGKEVDLSNSKVKPDEVVDSFFGLLR